MMRSGSFIAKWQDPLTWADRLDPSFLDYKYEDHNAEDDWLAITAEATIHNPIFKTTINVSVALPNLLGFREKHWHIVEIAQIRWAIHLFEAIKVNRVATILKF